MLYFAGIRALGENTYRETGECLEGQFHIWLNRAVAISMANQGKSMFVDFRQRPHTFEVGANKEPHLLTPEDVSMVDPALAAQFEGS